MPAIRPSELPETALLRKYQNGSGYADCYSVEVPAAVSHAEFVEAFYTTNLFKLERAILTWLSYLVQFVYLVPVLLLVLGPFFVRRIRRGLNAAVRNRDAGTEARDGQQ